MAFLASANSGLGYATTITLAAHGDRVFLACRNQSRPQEALERAKEEFKFRCSNSPTLQLEFVELDLGDMNKTRLAAQEILKKS
ncbi:hypothetical protein KI688_012571 [Linnemannia hyalina]|uniref:Uncharacterized protein n=1 Tax=Linnemannia hyalina TaxID=64524 RepID=A0A9P7XU41_9FUNG|nr:hypothetical protein KI688_012571 [Linnemannia hyalina]